MRGVLRPIHPTASVGRSETPNFLKSIHNLARSAPTKFGTLRHCLGYEGEGGKGGRRKRRPSNAQAVRKNTCFQQVERRQGGE